MNDKQAMNILMSLRDKPSLTAEEREAVSTAIGILSWSSLGESRIKRIIEKHKAKRERSGENGAKEK